jgi:hypothetical protein
MYITNRLTIIKEINYSNQCMFRMFLSKSGKIDGFSEVEYAGRSMGFEIDGVRPLSHVAFFA